MGLSLGGVLYRLVNCLFTGGTLGAAVDPVPRRGALGRRAALFGLGGLLREMGEGPPSPPSAPPNPPPPRRAPRVENGKAFEELVVDGVITRERAWREKSDIDVHQGVYRDTETQTILSLR